jgi:hypothetical protein
VSNRYKTLGDAERLKVVIKANDLQTSRVDPMVQEMDVEEVIIHPKFVRE